MPFYAKALHYNWYIQLFRTFDLGGGGGGAESNRSYKTAMCPVINIKYSCRIFCSETLTDGTGSRLINTHLIDRHVGQTWIISSLCCRCLHQYCTVCIVRSALSHWTQITSVSLCQFLWSCVRSRVIPGTAVLSVIW